MSVSTNENCEHISPYYIWTEFMHDIHCCVRAMFTLSHVPERQYDCSKIYGLNGIFVIIKLLSTMTCLVNGVFQVAISRFLYEEKRCLNFFAILPTSGYAVYIGSASEQLKINLTFKYAEMQINKKLYAFEILNNLKNTLTAMSNQFCLNIS